MKHYNIFPPDLDTPFNEALAFLLRVVTDEREQSFLRQLAEYNLFMDIHPLDRAAFFNLLIEFHYFDLPTNSTTSLDDLLADVDRLINDIEGGAE